jgi:PAS domain S-box-containing protein
MSETSNSTTNNPLDNKATTPTTQQKADESLSQTERTYKGFFDGSVVASYLFDTQKNIVDVNQAGVDLLGYTRDEMLTMGISDIDENPDAVEAQNELLAGGTLVNIEHKLKKKDGSIITVLNNSSPLTDGEGIVVGLQTTLTDITERRLTEEALRESEKIFATIFESSSISIGLTQVKNNQFIDVNKAWLDLTGYDKDEVINKSSADLNLYANLEDRAKILTDMKKDGRAYGHDMQIRKKNGDIANLLLSAEFIELESESIILTTAQDITNRKKTEEALKISEQRSMAYLENSPACTKIVDLDFNLQYMSNAGVEGLHIDNIEEYYGKPYPFYFYPDSFKVPMTRNLKKSKETDEIITQEAPVVDVDGNELWFHSTIVPVKDNDGLLEYLMVVSIDVTERRQAEESLKQSEEKSRNLITKMMNAFALHELIYNDKGEPYDYRFLELNPAWEELVGIKAETVIGKTIREIMPNIEESWIERYGRVVETGIAEEFEEFNIGTGKFFHCYAYCPEPGKFAVFFSDITESKLAEESLRKSEEMMRSSQSLAHICSYSTNLNVTHIEESAWVCSPEFYNIFGMDESYPHTIEGWANFIHPDYRKEVFEYHDSVVRERKEFNREYKIVRINDGAERWVKGSGKLVFDEKGTPIRMYGAIQDITERKEAEEALIKSEELLSKTAKLSGIGGWALSFDTGVVTWTEETYKIFGINYDREAPKLPEAVEFFTPKSKQILSDAIDLAKKTGTPYDLQLEIITPNNNNRWVHTIGEVHRENGEIVSVSGTIQDITEKKNSEEALKQAETQLHQSRKMDAVGQLAGGIAHDFNNSLAGILGAAEIMESGTCDEEEQKQFIDMIITAAERAGELTNKLLLFSRKGNKASNAVDMSKIIDDTLVILGHTIDRSISISTENNATQTTIIGDESLLQSALVNMAINASHAMPDGGLLTFTLDNLRLDRAYCEASPFEIEPGEYLSISIRDTGFGMTPEIQSHIFEPFYTTKEQGKGTGLGLAAVYGTVQDHNGLITVYSEMDTGTVFHLYLPISGAEINSIEEQTATTGSGTILVIDDDELIRITATTLLESLGYKVLSAENGQIGVQRYNENRETIDLVILDMIMPIMGGRETLTKIREIDSEIPVVISSGFSKEDDISAMKVQGISGFLHKPFRLADLAEMVSGAIAKIEK